MLENRQPLPSVCFTNKNTQVLIQVDGMEIEIVYKKNFNKCW